MKNALMSLRAQLKNFRQESLVETLAYDTAISEAEKYAKQQATGKELESRETSRLNEIINKKTLVIEGLEKNLARLTSETSRLQAIIHAEKKPMVSWVEDIVLKIQRSPTKILGSERLLLIYIASVYDAKKHDLPLSLVVDPKAASAATGIAATTIKAMLNKLPATGLCSKAGRGLLLLKERECTKST